MYKAKEDLLWFKKGELIEVIQDNWKPYFELIEEQEEINLDLNGDGIVDSKDASIASKVMNAVRKKKSSNNKKNRK